jgi:RHS repeat-associated protein
MIPSTQPDPSLAASAELAENSRLGFGLKIASLFPGCELLKSSTALGMRAAVTAKCVRANELTNWNGTSLSYDANGNMLGDGSNIFTWDARNQVASINGIALQYDAFGRRTENLFGTSFLFDGANAVQELNGSTVTANSIAGGTDEVFNRSDSSGTFTPLRDALGSTIALVNNSGSLSTTYSYDPFGNTSVSGSTDTNPSQYTGRENEQNGLYYNRARYYSSELGRFVSEDPIGFQGSGVNLYAYTNDNPINFTDRYGLQSGASSSSISPLKGPPACFSSSRLWGPSDPNYGAGICHKVNNLPPCYYLCEVVSGNNPLSDSFTLGWGEFTREQITTACPGSMPAYCPRTLLIDVPNPGLGLHEANILSCHP